VSEAALVTPLHSRVRRGLAWKAASSIVLQGSRLVIGIVLAHLLSPHDYGVAGMVVVFASLVLIFSDLAFSSALIQRRTLTEADRSTVFWTSAAVGLFLTLIGIALSGPIADFYGEPQVRPLFAAMSVSFFVASIASTQQGLLTRDMNFRSLELRQMAAALTAGATGITIAVLGGGPWAIIAQQIASAAVSTALLWVASPWRPKLTFSKRSLRELGGYSSNVFGSRLLFYANRNADNMLVGRFLGAASLGVYSVAYNLMLVPISQISIPVNDVLFPALSRLQDNVVSLRKSWLRANRVVAAISLPLLAGLVVVAPDFVHVALGGRWQNAAPVIQILACVGILQSVQGLNSSVLRAVDRTQALLRYSIIVCIASISAFAIGLHWGVIGVATAYAISSLFVEPYYSRLTAHAVGLRLRDFLKPLVGVAAAAGGMALTAWLVRRGAMHIGIDAAPRLILCIAVGALSYPAFCAWLIPDVLGELRELRRRRATA
jgi:polysaccharide transporter, PST family